MSSNQFVRACLVATAAIATCVSSAEARVRHHHHVMPAPETPYAAAPRPHQFYPEEVENGVRGNLPFNNQMRKFSDPLNANGGGGA